MNNFIMLTKRGDNKKFIIRNEDVISVIEEDGYCIVKYMLNGAMKIEHVKDSPIDIYTMLSYNVIVPGLIQKHLNS